MIKVRIQLGQGSTAQVIRTMIKEEGVGALSAAITKVKQSNPYYLHMPLEPISGQNQKQCGGVEKAV
ncbi:hypothetical protein ACFX2B_009677 [Malus domestica]